MVKNDQIELELLRMRVKNPEKQLMESRLARPVRQERKERDEYWQMLYREGLL